MRTEDSLSNLIIDNPLETRKPNYADLEWGVGQLRLPEHKQTTVKTSSHENEEDDVKNGCGKRGAK